MVHWLTGRYTVRTSAFGSLDFFGGDKPDDLTCPDCPERETCAEARSGRRIQCAFRREVDVEDNQVVILELEGGIKAAYLQCHFAPDYHRNYTVIGTKGRLENSELDEKVWVRKRGFDPWRQHTDRVIRFERELDGHGGADPVICRDFVAMCLDGKEPVSTPLAGRMSVAVGVCAARSLRHGGVPVAVPPPSPA
jgi:predicted dehydrogenase